MAEKNYIISFTEKEIDALSNALAGYNAGMMMCGENGEKRLTELLGNGLMSAMIKLTRVPHIQKEEIKMDDYKKLAAINDFAKEVHENAIQHGWWDENRSFGDIIALCHSELSEALEEYRNGKPAVYYNADDPDKPEGIAVEMCDVIIRVLDWLGKENIDAAELLYIKHNYNKTRPYKHGGKRI